MHFVLALVLPLVCGGPHDSVADDWIKVRERLHDAYYFCDSSRCFYPMQCQSCDAYGSLPAKYTTRYVLSFFVQATDASGRVYYWHRVTRKTTWRLPETATEKARTSGLGVWGVFSACSTTCGQGQQTRACIGGDKCAGESTKPCKMGTCPEPKRGFDFRAGQLIGDLPLVVDETAAVEMITRLASDIISSKGTEKKMQSSYFLQSVSRLANKLSLSLRASSMETNEFSEQLGTSTKEGKDTPPSVSEVISLNYARSFAPVRIYRRNVVGYFCYAQTCK